MNFSIVEIDESHRHWNSLLSIAEALRPVKPNWLTIRADHFISSHILAAMVDEHPVGFLRYVIQRLGEDEDRPPIVFKGQELREAKVIAFGVISEYRNRGIGRALQEAAIKQAKTTACYQLRSRSSYQSTTNFHLKISMGFGIQPSLEDDSVYFVMTLGE